MIETDFLRHLHRLSLIINKRVASNYIGQRGSIHGGQGLIFKDHRSYTPGDDFRAIDWKVYGRTDRLHVKRREEERNLTVHVILDFSSSMNFGSKALKKFEYASMLGIGFAYMALKNNERFVLSTFSDTLDRFKPRRGKKQLVTILDYLRTKKPEGESKFEESLKQYAKFIDSRSMIVIISYFLYEPEQVRRALFGFKNNTIKLIQVLDEIEIGMDLNGEFNLKDSETNNTLRTFISPFLRKNYLSKLQDHNLRMKRLAEGLGATFHTCCIEDNVFDTMFRILRQ